MRAKKDRHDGIRNHRKRKYILKKKGGRINKAFEINKVGMDIHLS